MINFFSEKSDELESFHNGNDSLKEKTTAKNPTEVNADLEVAKRFRHFLKKNRLRQREIAKQLGLSQQTISTYCRTGKMPRHVLIAMNSLFGLDIAWLLGEKGHVEDVAKDLRSINPAPVRNRYETVVNEGLSILEHTFECLNARGKAQLLDYGKQLRNERETAFHVEGTRNVDLHELAMIEIPFYGKIAAGNPIPAQQDWAGDRIAVPTDILPTANSEDYFCLQAEGSSMINCGIQHRDYAVFLKSEHVEQGQIAAVRVDSNVSIKRIFKRENGIEMRPCNPAYSTMRIGGEQYFKIEGVMVGLYRSRW